MAKKNQASESGNVPDSELSEDNKELVIAHDSIVDVPVTVVSLEADPYNKDGAEFPVGKKTAEMLVKRGWVEIKKQEKHK